MFLPFSLFPFLSFFRFNISNNTSTTYIFVWGISFGEKFYFPLFDAIEMQTPFAIFWHRIGTSGSFNEMRYTHAYEILPRYGFTVTSKRNEGVFRRRTRCRGSRFFIFEFLACLHTRHNFFMFDRIAFTLLSSHYIDVRIP